MGSDANVSVGAAKEGADPKPSVEKKKEAVSAPKGHAYKSLKGYPQTIGFSSGRTVTWLPFGIEGLTAEEARDPVFTKRLKNFKEVS